jgi:hypothetical protein
VWTFGERINGINNAGEKYRAR